MIHIIVVVVSPITLPASPALAADTKAIVTHRTDGPLFRAIPSAGATPGTDLELGPEPNKVIDG